MPYQCSCWDCCSCGYWVLRSCYPSGANDHYFVDIESSAKSQDPCLGCLVNKLAFLVCMHEYCLSKRSESCPLISYVACWDCYFYWCLPLQDWRRQSIPNECGVVHCVAPQILWQSCQVRTEHCHDGSVCSFGYRTCFTVVGY